LGILLTEKGKKIPEANAICWVSSSSDSEGLLKTKLTTFILETLKNN